jgi:transcriptional regulator with XRE-family HTH domain
LPSAAALPSPTWAEFERGKANPSLDTIETLAGDLKITVKALFED